MTECVTEECEATTNPLPNHSCSRTSLKMRLTFFARRRRSFDMDIINSDNISKLLIMIPEDEEIGVIGDFDGDKSMLGKVEQWMCEMIRIPRLKIRLDCCNVMLQFEEVLGLLQKKVDVVIAAAGQVKSSKNLLAVLEIVMTVGNHMNGGSTKGQAHGFKLDVLSKLTNVKANDRKKGNLMNFIVKQVSE